MIKNEAILVVITCTCTHSVLEFEETRSIALRSWDEIGNRCIRYVVYCLDCYAQEKRMSNILNNETDEREWLGIE